MMRQRSRPRRHGDDRNGSKAAMAGTPPGGGLGGATAAATGRAVMEGGVAAAPVIARARGVAGPAAGEGQAKGDLRCGETRRCRADSKAEARRGR